MAHFSDGTFHFTKGKDRQARNRWKKTPKGTLTMADFVIGSSIVEGVFFLDEGGKSAGIYSSVSLAKRGAERRHKKAITQAKWDTP